MRKPTTVQTLTDFGRVRLSKTFFMRDFLFSDIASVHGYNNVPDNPELAIAAGTRLCEDLLEPLQDRFGRIAIRSAFRSKEVNGFGNDRQRAGKVGYTCASNESNYAGHIWDERDADGYMGATACIVVPSFWDKFQGEGDWTKLAWWIQDHLPHAGLYFFPTYWAFNISWHEKPTKTIKSYATPKGMLTAPGMANFEGSHEAEWAGIEVAFASGGG
jgi:hypothetical protein